MTNDAVEARVVSVRDIHHALSVYERDFDNVIENTRSSLSRGQAEFQAAVAKSAREHRAAQDQVRRAAASLSACKENCSQLEEALRRAQSAELAASNRYRNNQRTLEDYTRAASDLSRTMGTICSSTSSNIGSAKKTLLDFAEDLSRYLAKKQEGRR